MKAEVMTELMHERATKIKNIRRTAQNIDEVAQRHNEVVSRNLSLSGLTKLRTASFNGGASGTVDIGIATAQVSED